MIKNRIIIKKIFFFVCIFLNFSLHSQINISIRALDSGRNELEQAKVGKPFILEVTVKGLKGSISDPNIEGVEDFEVFRSGYQSQTINSKTTANYNYSIRIDKEGSYSIGPITVQDDNEIVRSGIFIIKVGKKELLQQSNIKTEKQDKKMFLQIVADNKSVVVGQKLEGEIIFYCSIANVSIHSINNPDIDGFIRLEKENPTRGTSMINGRQYSYMKWRWKFFPKQAGDHLFPSGSVDITVQREDDFFSNFSSFFHVRSERKRLYSNSLEVNVKPLPSHTKMVNAVGRFSNFNVKINQSVAKEGDGIVVSLSLDGDTDLENLFLELQDIPHVFRSYRSKQYIDEINDSDIYKKKTFEFIVQGMEAGEWEIPEQKFTYYDVLREVYETLTTEPLIIKILPSSITKKYVPPSIDNSTKTLIDVDGNIDDGSIFLNENGCWYKVKERKISWSLFLILFFAPLGVWISGFFNNLFLGYNNWRKPKLKWKNSFKIARAKLKKGKKKSDATMPYRVFVELFTVRCSVNEPEVSEKMTKDVLRSGGLSNEKLLEWEKFFSTASAFVFYSVKGEQEQKDLFDQSEKWITILEEIL